MRTDLAVVGAGPAGLSAAHIAASTGLEVVIIDEQARAGGQILRQPPAGIRVERWLAQGIYRPQQTLLREAESAAGIRWLHRTTMLGINSSQPELMLSLISPQGITSLTAERVLIATGCHDMPVSFPGSTLPGVMATGGIQGFIKSQQVVPGKRFVFAGSHPLQLIVADQVQQAGGQVSAVLFSQHFGVIRQLLRSPGPLLRYPGKLAYLASAYWRLLRRGVPVRFGQTVRRALGDDALHSVEVTPVAHLREDRATGTIPCDRLGVGFGFLANSQLVAEAGARGHWSDTAGGWLAVHDEWMRSTVPKLYVAGEITGVGGADVSQREGEIAGFGIALDAGCLSPLEAARKAQPARRALRGLQRFAHMLSTLSHPGQALLRNLMQDDSVLCKCEEITVRQVTDALVANPFAGDLSAAKLLSRCGMGLCQGRYCHYQLRTLLAQVRGTPAQDCGGFTTRFPVKPVTIADLTAEDDQAHG